MSRVDRNIFTPEDAQGSSMVWQTFHPFIKGITYDPGSWRPAGSSQVLPSEGVDYIGEGYQKILAVTKKTRRRVLGILETDRAVPGRGC